MRILFPISSFLILIMVESNSLPKAYMLMFNISKAKNFGTIVRSAAAFNISEIFLVEPPGKKNKIAAFGS